ncbi:hypothetical protein [Microbispora sp. NPDC046933]|uniref:hypothetical protein n=1 Tax=Microbispora sp. NPDC046933 TaxID=3155618 RepID=UPI0033F58877
MTDEREDAMPDLLPLLDRVTLTGTATPAAGLLTASLPWPRAAVAPLALGGRPTGAQPLGRWPGTGFPRRLLLAADAGPDGAPDRLHLTRAAVGYGDPPRPQAVAEVFARSDEPGYLWERSLLRLRLGNRSVALAMGLRTGGEVHWWEGCRLVVHAESAEELVVEMGGAVPHHVVSAAAHAGLGTYGNPYLHRHNWLTASLFVRAHRNGVCEVVARHVNGRFVDDGRELADVVPVLGVRAEGDTTAPAGPWDGGTDLVRLGGVEFDMTEVARLSTPDRPGELSEADGWLVLAPYAGVEILGGLHPQEVTGQPYLFRARERAFPRGMARSLRFSLSLSDRPATVVRYLAPDWWYGLCEELSGAPVLPVAPGRAARMAADWLAGHVVSGGFEDGTVPRNDKQGFDDSDGRRRYEPGWEGEVPYAAFLAAWRTGDSAAHARALRIGYAVTDIAVDHAAHLTRMHGHPPNALSLPMTRVLGTVASYLETGDPFLLRTARAAVDAAHAVHLSAWPRLTVGRDACYLRGAAMLYRYLGDDHYRALCLEGAHTVVASQRPNGSFGDQGGGVGLHGWNAYITKPWMGLLALGGVLDYLELCPGTEPLHAAVLRFGDWLLAERQRHGDREGWAYQHDYDGEREHRDVVTGRTVRLPTGLPLWHHDTLARLLGYCTMTTGNPEYVESWLRSHTGFWDAAEAGDWPTYTTDHVVAATLQFVPWLYDRLWNVRWDGAGTVPAPVAGGAGTLAATTVSTPYGVRPLSP